MEVSKDPVGWRLGVYPSRPDLPILAKSSFTVPFPRKDDAHAARRTNRLKAVLPYEIH